MQFVSILKRHYFTANAAITVAGIRIESVNKGKYLGVIFDKTLKFKTHLQYIIEKGTRAAMVLSDISKNSRGTQYKCMCQLFKLVVAVLTDYLAIIWYRAKTKKLWSTHK
jgi:hypothetical protein